MVFSEGYVNMDNILTLISRPILTLDNIRISKNSFYRDNKWDFSTENPELRAAYVTFNFNLFTFQDGTTVCSLGNEVYLDIAKAYTYSLLIDPIPTNPKLSTLVKGQRYGLKTLLRFMHKYSIKRLADITEEDVNNLREDIINTPHIAVKQLTNRTLMARIKGFSYIEIQSPKLIDGLKVSLLQGITETEWSRSNAAKTIGRFEKITIEMPDIVARQLYEKAIDQIECYQKLIDIREAKEKFKTIRKYKVIKKENGDNYYKPVYQELFPYGEFGITNGHDIRSMQSKLLAAGYILIAMFTGMRIHEVLNIKYANNFVTESITYNDEEQVISFVISKSTKLEAVPTAYKWQTLPFISEVLDKIKAGLGNRYDNGHEFLFASNRLNFSHPISSMRMNQLLKEFVEYHHITHNGKLWHLSSHQFRKKFARIMVRQGLGIKALQDQLKHYDIEMTKVYGDPNLFIELQQEKFALSEELYEELITNQIPIIGGGSEEVNKLRKEFRGMNKDDRIKFLQSLPNKALIEQTDDGLCIYRPNKSLCAGDKSACRPADCNNSIIPANGKRRTLEWRMRENKRLIAFFKNDSLKVSHLNERIREIDSLLKQLVTIEAHNE